jgi:hypothetical protein
MALILAGAMLLDLLQSEVLGCRLGGTRISSISIVESAIRRIGRIRMMRDSIFESEMGGQPL